MDRPSQLKQFIKEDPGDPFNYYALALEYLKANPTEAASIFKKLTEAHPTYLPSYYPYAQLLIERKDTQNAEKIFLRGIEVAKAAKDQKTLKELQGAYQDWLYGL